MTPKWAKFVQIWENIRKSGMSHKKKVSLKLHTKKLLVFFMKCNLRSYESISTGFWGIEIFWGGDKMISEQENLRKFPKNTSISHKNSIAQITNIQTLSFLYEM